MSYPIEVYNAYYNLRMSLILSSLITLTQNGSWKSEISIDSDSSRILIVNIHLKPNTHKLYRYMIVTFEDISDLKQYQKNDYINKLITENPVPHGII